MNFIKEVLKKIRERKIKNKENSYICAIIKNRKYIKKKVMEEAFEFCNESKKKVFKKKFVNEFCDLLFHSLLLFEFHNIDFSLVKKEMLNRLKSV
ncbi:phosphoribosyl-ATP diphosphatase [Candidatus Vidania fulgoroideorum]